MFHLGQFLTYTTVTAGTPGPNTIMSMSNASQKGFKKALPFNFGIWAGFAIIASVCTLLCSVLAPIIEKIKTPMLIFGAGYMLYLAYKIFRSNGELEAKESKGDFFAGMVFQFINPKVYIYSIVSMEAYVIPYFNDKPLVLVGFALFLATNGFILTLCWAAFGSLFRKLFSKYARITNTIMALLLVYCAVSLFK